MLAGHCSPIISALYSRCMFLCFSLRILRLKPSVSFRKSLLLSSKPLPASLTIQRCLLTVSLTIPLRASKHFAWRWTCLSPVRSVYALYQLVYFSRPDVAFCLNFLILLDLRQSDRIRLIPLPVTFALAFVRSLNEPMNVYQCEPSLVPHSLPTRSVVHCPKFPTSLHLLCAKMLIIAQHLSLVTMCF